MRRDTWCIGAALSIGMIFALVVLEVGLRLVTIPVVEIHRRGPVTFEDHRQFFTYDPELGWRGRPNVKGSFSGWEFTTLVHLNELGFRTHGLRHTKQPTQYEILLLGDSITWGYGVEEGRRYSDLLEKELATFGVNAVINNVAVPGYDTGLELLLYRQLKGLGCPDVVAIGLYANDIWENGSPTQGPYAKPYFKLIENQLQPANIPVAPSIGWENTHVESDEAWAVWMRKHLRVYVLAAWMKETVRQMFEDKPSATVEPETAGVEVTAALLRELAAEVERDHLRAAVIVLPGAAELAKTTVLATETAASQSAIKPVLQLTDAFRAAVEAQHRPLFFHLDGAHWTEQAHEVAARHLARLLVETDMFKQAPRQCKAQV